MGNTFGSVCNNGSYCLKKEIETEPNELTEENRTLERRRNTRFNTYQISNVISETIITKRKSSEENMIILNTDKNTFPSNKENSLDDDLNLNNMDSIFTEKLEEEKNENSTEKDNIKLTNFGNPYFKKTLFNKQSVKSIKNLKKLFKSYSKKKKDEENEEDEKEDEEENKNEIIIYRGEVCSFVGELKQKDPLNGRGILTLNSGEILEGYFIDGKLNKHGKYIDENGNIFEGNFQNGVLNGKGSIIKLKKSRNNSMDVIDKIEYYGDIENFKKEGSGKEICQKYIYKGNFHNDMKEGKGKIKYNGSGDIYEGEFQNDKINGYGTYKWKNKSEYSGYFLDGEMNGEGIFKWPNGTQYEGNYVHGIKQGIGKFKWSSGKVFEGIFKNGKPNGNGIIEYDNTKYNALYKNGKIKKLKTKLKDDLKENII